MAEKKLGPREQQLREWREGRVKAGTAKIKEGSRTEKLAKVTLKAVGKVVKTKAGLRGK